VVQCLKSEKRGIYQQYSPRSYISLALAMSMTGSVVKEAAPSGACATGISCGL
jgi:hypothetical protein